MVDVSSAKPMASPETSTAQRTPPAQPAGSAPLSFVTTFSDVLQASLQGSAAPAAPGAMGHVVKPRAGSIVSPATSGAPALSDSAPAATLPNPLFFQFPWASSQEALAQPAALSLSVASAGSLAEPGTPSATAATSSGSPLRQPYDPRTAAATPFDGTEEEITAPGAGGSVSAVLFPAVSSTAGNRIGVALFRYRGGRATGFPADCCADRRANHSRADDGRDQQTRQRPHFSGHELGHRVDRDNVVHSDGGSLAGSALRAKPAPRAADSDSGRGKQFGGSLAGRGAADRFFGAARLSGMVQRFVAATFFHCHRFRDGRCSGR